MLRDLEKVCLDACHSKAAGGVFEIRSLLLVLDCVTSIQQWSGASIAASADESMLCAFFSRLHIVLVSNPK